MVTSKALNTCRNDPVLIQAYSEGEGRGYQSGAAELSLGARLRSLCAHKAPAPGDPRGTEAAAEESPRWGRAPVHALPPPPTDVLSSVEDSGTAESELSLQRAFSRERSRSNYSSYSGGCERSDPESPFAICSSS